MQFNYFAILAVGLALLVMPSLTLAIPENADNVRTEQETTSVDRDEIDRWITQLASDTYVLRIQAMEKLFQKGEAAAEKLRGAAKSDVHEIARRSRYLLALIDMGITPDTQAGLARNILEFHNADSRQRNTILRKLYENNRFEIVLKLLELTDLSFQKQWIGRNWSAGDVIGQTQNLENQREELIRILLRPIFWRTRLYQTLHYSAMLGQLENQFAQLKKRVDQQKMTKGQRQLETNALVAIALRQQDLNAAKPYLDRLPKLERAVFLTDWHLRRRDWKQAIEIDDQLDPNREAMDDFFASINTPQKLLLLQWSNQNARYQKLMDAIVKNTNLNDPAAVQLTIHYLVMNLEIEKAIKLFAKNDQPEMNFTFLCNINRFKEAFATLNWGDTRQEQLEWFQSETKTLAELSEKLRKRYNYETYKRINKIFQKLLTVADQVGKLGDRKFAYQLYNVLADADKEMDYRALSRRRSILKSIRSLGDNQLTWKFLGERFQDRDLRSTLSTLFDNTVSGFWYSVVEDKVKDPHAVLKTVAILVNSPIAPADLEVDLDHWIELGFQKAYQLPVNSRGVMLTNLAKTLLFHGRNSQAIDTYREACDSGYTAAFKDVGQQLMEANRWQEAADCFNSSFEAHQNLISQHMAMICQQQSGQYINNRSTLGLMNLTVEANYQSSTLVYQLSNIRRHREAIEYLKPLIESTPFSNNVFYTYQSYLAKAYDEIESKHAPAANQLAALASANNLRTRAATDHFFLNGRKAELAVIQQLVANKKLDQAWKRIQKFNRVYPANSNLAEHMVPLLENAGRKDLADQLFNQIADGFEKILKRYPQSPLHLNNYAWICACCNRRFDKSLQLAELATQLRPNNSNYLDTLAEIQFQLGHREKAVELIKKCIRLDPTKIHYRRQLSKFTKKPDRSAK